MGGALPGEAEHKTWPKGGIGWACEFGALALGRSYSWPLGAGPLSGMTQIDRSPPAALSNAFELQTRLGPADARVDRGGRLFLSWKGSVVLNKVRYIQAQALSVDAGGPDGDAEISLTREDYRPGSARARSLLLEEAMRHLHEVTPERAAWAAHLAWSRELTYAEQTLDTARQTLEAAQAKRDLALAERQCAKAELAQLGLEVQDG